MALMWLGDWADLDRSNVSNAYVSGMREELHMYGTQFNVGLPFACACSYDVKVHAQNQQINTIFTCGYIIGMIPSEFLSS